MIGDFVLQNLWVFELGDEWNSGLGNRTVFLAHGRFLGDTLFTLFSIKFSLSISLLWRGEDTKSMRDLARWRDGEMDDRVDRDVTCFSLFLRARISEFSGFVGLWFFRQKSIGVFGSEEGGGGFLVLEDTAATISLANWLACRISPTVSPTSIAGNDILLHSPVFVGNFPGEDFRGLEFLILKDSCLHLRLVLR